MDLQISPKWIDDGLIRLDSTPRYDVIDDCSVCELNILLGEESITEIEDSRQETHSGPRVSAFTFAEWLIWNWWRLRWEPSPTIGDDISWRQAHEITSIGEGWIWPKVVFESDGKSVSVKSYGSEATETEPISFVRDDRSEVISADAFEVTVDDFVLKVISHLRGIAGNPLAALWRELEEERKSHELTIYRRLEALLGNNPDEGDEATINRLTEEGENIGPQTTYEIASALATMPKWDYRSSGFLMLLAYDKGFSIGGDTPMTDNTRTYMKGESTGELNPWVVGSEAARIVRQDENLSDRVTDGALADICGLPSGALTKNINPVSPFTYSWSDTGNSARVTFREKNNVDRRISAARLLGDKMLVGLNEPLRPVLHTNTFRQKIQRSFAIELLCPSQSLFQNLNGDYSDAAISEAAKYFQVDANSVKANLQNNRF